MGGYFSDIRYRLPEEDKNKITSTCLPFTLKLSEIEEFSDGDVFELTAYLYSQNPKVTKDLDATARIQIITPVNDPEILDKCEINTLKSFYDNSIEIERVSWSEGRKAEITFIKTGNITNDVEIYFLIIFQDFVQNPEDFSLRVDGNLSSKKAGKRKLIKESVNFTFDDNDTFFEADNKTLIELFKELNCFNLDLNSSMIHPKQIHTYNATYSQLKELSEHNDKPLRLTYIGPDTCENLHSTIRAINNASKEGVRIDSLTIGHTDWDEILLDDAGILEEGYFQSKGVDIPIILTNVNNLNEVKSDIIILTYVANWAYSNNVRGNSIDQFLGNILQKINPGKTILLSIDPTDIKRTTRSFYCMGSSNPNNVYLSANLERHKTAPGGYGSTILSEEREVCWVRKYQHNTLQRKPVITEPAPNLLARELKFTNPTGRDAKIDRLTYPNLHLTTIDELVNIVNENKQIERLNFVDLNNKRSFYTNKMNIIVGGPGDGKSVLLQKLAWEFNSNNDDLTIFLPARLIVKQENMVNLRMNLDNDEMLIKTFCNIMEQEAKIIYNDLNWNDDVENWLDTCGRTYIFLDALDEIRDKNIRFEFFNLIHKLNLIRDDISFTISFREAITELLINKQLGEVTEEIPLNNTPIVKEDDYQILKIIWEENDLKKNFIPSLLHAWDMRLDNIAYQKLSRLLRNSIKEQNRGLITNNQPREFLQNPLRVVWLVKLIFEDNKDLLNMNLADFESEILKSTVRDRFELRILGGNSVNEGFLQEMLDIIYTLSILDYPWSGKQITFDKTNRNKFISDIITHSSSISNIATDNQIVRQYVFEDLSLLYITGDDNLSWIHENLREHAISLGLSSNKTSKVISNLLKNWDFKVPTIQELIANSGRLCSYELTRTVLRNLPLNEFIDEIIQNYQLRIDENLDQMEKLDSIYKSIHSYVNDVRSERNELNDETTKFVEIRNQHNKEVKRLISLVKSNKDIRNKNNLKVKKLKEIRTEKNSRLKQIKNKSKQEGENKNLIDELALAIEEQKKAHDEVQKYAQEAQEAHDLMMQYNEQVEREREKAETIHKKLRGTKKEADKKHFQFMASVNILPIIQSRQSNANINREAPKIINDEDYKLISTTIQNLVRNYTNSNNTLEQNRKEDFDITEIYFEGEQIIIEIETTTLFHELLKLKNQISENLEAIINEKVFLKFIRTPIQPENIKLLVEEFFENENMKDISLNDITTSEYIHSRSKEKIENRFIHIQLQQPTPPDKLSWLSNKIEDYLLSKIGPPLIVRFKPMNVTEDEAMGFLLSEELINKKVFSEFNATDIKNIINSFQITKSTSGITGRRIIFSTENFEFWILRQIRKEFLKKFGPPLELKAETSDLIPVTKDLINKLLEQFKLKENLQAEFNLGFDEYFGSKNRQITIQIIFEDKSLSVNDTVIKLRSYLEEQIPFIHVRFSQKLHVEKRLKISYKQISEKINEYFEEYTNFPRPKYKLAGKTNSYISPKRAVCDFISHRTQNFRNELEKLRKFVKDNLGVWVNFTLTPPSTTKRADVEKTLNEIIDLPELEHFKTIFSRFELYNHNPNDIILLIKYDPQHKLETNTIETSLFTQNNKINQHLSKILNAEFNTRIKFDLEDLKAHIVKKYVIELLKKEFGDEFDNQYINTNTSNYRLVKNRKIEINCILNKLTPEEENDFYNSLKLRLEEKFGPIWLKIDYQGKSTPSY